MANFNSAKAAIIANQQGGSDKDLDTAVHAGWGKTVDQAPAPNPEKQAARKKLQQTPFSGLSKDEQDKDTVLRQAVLAKEEMMTERKRGLWDNIHAKRERIKHGSGEHMRKPGSKGAPTDAAIKASQNEEADPCWDNYKQVGMKMKGGKKVPNCVPVKEAANAAQQAAIAIAMKKAGKKPKNEIKEADEKFTNRVQPENDTPDTDASDRQAAVGKVGLK